MNRVRAALTVLVFMFSLALPSLVEALPIRPRPRGVRFRMPDGTYNRSAQARAQNRGPNGRFRPGFRADAPTSPGTAIAVRPRGDISTTSAGGRHAAAGGGGGGSSTALARSGDAGGSTALARRDAGGTPARVDGPTAGGRAGADGNGSFTEAAFHEQARRSGMQRIDGPDGTVGYRNPRDGTEVHYIPAEGRMAVRRPDGGYEMMTVLNRDAIDTAFRRGRTPPRAVTDVQPIGGRTRAGADAPGTAVVRSADAPVTTRASADAPVRAEVPATAATRKGRFRGLGRGLLLGTVAFSGGYALRNTMGDDPDNSPGSIDNTPGFGQSTAPGGTAGTGSNNTSGTGVTSTGGSGTSVTGGGTTALGSGALYPGGGGTNNGAPGVNNGGGTTGPTGIATGDPRDRTTSDQDQDGFAVGSLNRPPSRVRLSTGDFNFGN